MRSLDSSQLQVVNYVASLYPRLRISKARFIVLGENVVIPNAIITLAVEVSLISLNQLRRESKNGSKDPDAEFEVGEEEKKKWWVTSKQPNPVHAPYFPAMKRPTWWVFMAE